MWVAHDPSYFAHPCSRPNLKASKNKSSVNLKFKKFKRKKGNQKIANIQKSKKVKNSIYFANHNSGF
jgi:hypothetical protein